MKIIVFGGTGFIGSALLNSSFFQQHEVFIVTRHPDKRKISPHENFHFVKADDQLEVNLSALFSEAYGIINLAGESLSHWPWSKVQRQRILLSRVRITKMIGDLVNKATTAPQFIIQSSAIGYYGFEHSGKITERNEAGSNFLALVCKEWEDSLQLKNQKTRVAVIRTGLVLGKEGGLLELLKLPFYLFVGGPLGSGKQMVSWIHLEDEINAIVFLIKNDHAEGPFNLVAPEPISMNVLLKTIGKMMNRPFWFWVPAFVLRLFLGKTFANELVLKGQDVSSEKLIESGYSFKYKDIESALSDLI